MAELRKVEQELSLLSSEWGGLRKKTPKFDDNDDTSTSDDINSLAKIMPSWKELLGMVNDAEIFPPHYEEEIDEETAEVEDMKMKDKSAADDADALNFNNTNANANANADEGGYSEFGMCLGATEDDTEKDKNDRKTAATNGASIFERYAAKESTKSKDKKEVEKTRPPVHTTPDQSEDDDEMLVENASPNDVLAGFESLEERYVALKPKIEKMKTKLKDRDPITKKPRYGEKTLPRVKDVIRNYKALEFGMAIVFTVVSSLRIQIQKHTEQINAKIQTQQSMEQLEVKRLAKEKELAEEHITQQRLLEEQKKREEEQELARRAEEARLRRIEEEQRVLDAERRADEELLALVPT